MPNHISKKKLEPKLLDIWENEGGRITIAEMKLKTINTRSKGKRKNHAQRRSHPAALVLNNELEADS